MAGAMIGAATGRLSLQEIRHSLEGQPGGPQIPALPAQGLALWEVEYPPGCGKAESVGQIPDGPIFPL
jgi:tRNA U38,U39,U40 pseudouridine synthase TruA